MVAHVSRCPHFQRLNGILSGQGIPNYKVITALHLPTEQPNPKFIRVKLWEQSQGGDSPTRWVPDLSQVFGTSEPVAIDNLTITSHANGAPLHRPLQVFFRNTFRFDSSPCNQCLGNMVQGGAIPYPWAGDMVVLKFFGTRQEDYCDVRDEDIPPLVYYLLSNDFGFGGSS